MRLTKSTWLFLVFAGVTGATVPAFTNSATAQGPDTSTTGSMRGMRNMMQRMMGDRLPPGIDPALLPDPQSHGVQILKHYCTQCHNLPGPGMHTAAEWPAVVNRMDQRMEMMRGGMMGNIEAPSRQDLSVLLRYLQAHAQRPLNPKKYRDLDTSAGRSFQAVCTQCHALPDPQQHTAAEWPGVVTRMQKNMASMAKPIPDERTLRQILGFLQAHARKPT